MSEEKKEEILEQEKELDANELDDVAGGSSCVCFAGGGGAEVPGQDKVCVCIAAGAGEWTKPDDNGNTVRCACAAIGVGKY